MGEKVLELVYLQKQFGDHTVLRDIHLSVEKGEVLSVIGASGSGKSTMLRCINLLETPTSGRVLYRGQDITAREMNLSQYRAKIGMVFLLFWAVVLIIFSKDAVALFRNDPEVIAIGIPALRYQMIMFPVCSFMMMSNMMMQTCRKTIRANILAASRQGLFFIPLIIILPHCFGLFGVEICQAVSDLISFVVTIPIVWSAFREMK